MSIFSFVKYPNITFSVFFNGFLGENVSAVSGQAAHNRVLPGRGLGLQDIGVVLVYERGDLGSRTATAQGS